MEKEQDYIVLLDRFLKGGTSPEEEKDLLDWFRKTAPEEVLYAYYRSYWDNAHGKSIPADVQGRMFHQIKLRMKEMEQKRKNIRKLRLWWASTAAAVVALCVSIGISVHYFRQVNQMSQQTFVVSAEKGQRSNVVLPDGTVLTLNSCSRVRYPNQFVDNERRVELEGEGFFQVSRNEKQPFIINTRFFDVRVLGTCFNVKSYSSDETVMVDVESGKVQVDMPEAMMRLQANEQVRINTMSGEYSKQREEHAVAVWRGGGMRFDATPIHDVAKELERMYNCRITFAQGQSFDNLISGEHDNKSLEAVLQSIEYTSGIHYKISGQEVLLYK